MSISFDMNPNCMIHMNFTKSNLVRCGVMRCESNISARTAPHRKHSVCGGPHRPALFKK